MENQNNADIEEKQPQQKKRLKNKLVLILGLQLAVLLYSFAGVTGKFTSRFAFLSWQFILLFGLEVFILFLYAIVWQQLIKRTELSTAYTNKATSLVWSLVWSIVIFSETITLKNILGVAIVVIGTIVVNLEK